MNHKTDMQTKFPNVSCSQCGRDFGPGNSGFSDCRSHAFRDWFYREGCWLDAPTKEQCVDAQQRAFEAALASRPDAQADERGAFEAWWQTTNLGDRNQAWQGWKARAATPQAEAVQSRKSALEEASDVCRDLGEDWAWAAQGHDREKYDDMAYAAGECAKSIIARIEIPFASEDFPVGSLKALLAAPSPDREQATLCEDGGKCGIGGYCGQCEKVRAASDPEQPNAHGERQRYSKEWCMKMAALEPEDGPPPAGIAALDASAPTLSEQHTDDLAVDSFARVMKEKMAAARAKGRSGWEGADPAELSRMLREHVEKGDPRDVANFCMMLWHHSAQIASQPQAAEPKGMTATLRSYFETIVKYLEADLPGLALNTAEKARDLLSKGE